MKRIALCFDGTWNKAEQEVSTNVARLSQVLERSEQQLAWYDMGVGTSQWEKLRGAFGFGLSRNIQQGYAYLSLTYEPGDHIFLFGFSRGAYTARSLAGLIRKCGILRPEKMPSVKLHGLTDMQVQGALDEAIKATPLVEEAYDLYRQRDQGPDTEQSQRFRGRHSHPVYDPTQGTVIDSRRTRIRFIGVWDTVGNLGVPLKTLRWMSVLNRNRYLFHDTRLSGIVEYARHALAIDEYRADYSPTLWTPDDSWPSHRLRQRWFIGAHGDVGGGYAEEQPLADLAFLWMVHEAQTVGLQVRDIVSLGRPDNRTAYLAPITPTYTRFLFGIYKWVSSPKTRPVAEKIQGESNIQYRNQETDQTVGQRLREDTVYHPNWEALRSLAGIVR